MHGQPENLIHGEIVNVRHVIEDLDCTEKHGCADVCWSGGTACTKMQGQASQDSKCSAPHGQALHIAGLPICALHRLGAALDSIVNGAACHPEVHQLSSVGRDEL